MKRIIAALLTVILLCALCSSVAFASSHPSRVVDGADVLTDSEKNSLASKLDGISAEYSVDIAVVTVESLGGESPAYFTESYFRDNGYGLGDDKDGIMLLFSAEVVDGGRDYYIYYSGVGYDAVNNDVEDLKDAIVGYLKSDDFVSAFDTFADECENYVDIEINGAPFNAIKSLIISLVIGFIIALISVSVMKGKLKSVRFQTGAANYQVAGSLRITDSRDVFLYRNVVRRARPQNTSGGGGGGSRSGGSGGKC